MYEKQYFTNDQPLDAAQLNHMEEGIANSYTANDRKLAKVQKDTIDKLCPTMDDSGRLVQCSPAEGYPLQVVSYIEESVSGHTSVTLTHCGKNLYDKDAFPLSPGAIRKASGAFQSYGTIYCTLDFIPVSQLRGQTITLNHPVSISTMGTAFYDEDQSYISGISGSTMVVPDDAVYMRFSVPYTYRDGSQIQIELGDTVTDFEPYWEKTCTVELDDECGGGTLDWSRGLLTVTHKKVDMASLDWQYNEDNCYFYADLPDGAMPDVSKANDAISNAFTWEPDTYGGITTGGVPNGGFFDISDEDGTCRIAVACWDADTIATFLDILTGTDAVLVYPMAEPVTQELVATPIPAAAGINTLYSSTGTTQVSGRADPVVLIAKLETTLASALERITKLEQAYPIKFEFMGVTFTATNGQTWAEYIARLDELECYGCGAFYKEFSVIGGKVYYNEGCGNADTCGSMSYPLAADGVKVSADDLIMDGYIYENY